MSSKGAGGPSSSTGDASVSANRDEAMAKLEKGAARLIAAKDIQATPEMPRVLAQVAAGFLDSIHAEAMKVARHMDRDHVSADDVEIAFARLTKDRAFAGQAAHLRQLSKVTNSQQLPKLRDQPASLHLPPDRYCSTAPVYAVTPKAPPAPHAATTSATAGATAPPPPKMPRVDSTHKIPVNFKSGDADAMDFD